MNSCVILPLWVFILNGCVCGLIGASVTLALKRLLG